MMDAVLQWCRGAKFAEICKVGNTLQPIVKAEVLPDDRRIWGIDHQVFPTSSGIAATNGSGGTCYWEYGAEGEVLDELGNAGEAEYGGLQSLVSAFWGIGPSIC